MKVSKIRYLPNEMESDSNTSPFNCTAFPFHYSTLQLILTRRIVIIIELCWMLNAGKERSSSYHCVNNQALRITWEFSECQPIAQDIITSAYVNKSPFSGLKQGHITISKRTLCQPAAFPYQNPAIVNSSFCKTSPAVKCYRVEARVCLKKTPLHWVPDNLERKSQDSSEGMRQTARSKRVRSWWAS